MTNIKAIQNRHAVRSYTNKAINELTMKELNEEIQICNKEGSLKIQLITNDRRAFSGFMAKFGKFKGVSNYIALIGPKSHNLDEKIGYYGERIALKAQQLGLNTCWVGATYNKRKCSAAILEDESSVCVLALGYGTTQGIPHKSKNIDQLCKIDIEMPDWFIKGMEAAMLAPTALNKQDFLISLCGDSVKAEATGSSYAGIDLGIVKYHFEAGAGKDSFHWI